MCDPFPAPELHRNFSDGFCELCPLFRRESKPGVETTGDFLHCIWVDLEGEQIFVFRWDDSGENLCYFSEARMVCDNRPDPTCCCFGGNHAKCFWKGGWH